MTEIFETEFNDDRIFRVFCANSTQIRKTLQSYDKMKDKVKRLTNITSGIHTTKQYLKSLETM